MNGPQPAGSIRAGWVGAAFSLLLAGCAGTTARQLGPREDQVRPAGVVQIRWRTQLHEHGLFEPSPEECATGVMAKGSLVIGSRASNIVGVDPDVGQVRWVTSASGGIDSEARYDARLDQVYLGADDGSFYALEPTAGAVRWSYRAKGAIERPPAFGDGAVFVATALDQVIALDGATGKWRWQYERETPDGFTIHGYAGPQLHDGALLSGFADGYLVSLSLDAGEVLWARSLAAVSDQFVDVDTTPALLGDTAYVSSYSGGLYAVNSKDGVVRWRLGIEGAGQVKVVGQRLYFAAPRHGIHAVDLGGHVLWRQALSAAGDLTAPVTVGPYLVFSGSRAGMFILDRETGRLLEIFNPGSGICAAPTLDAAKGRLYVLSNGGTLYALDLT